MVDEQDGGARGRILAACIACIERDGIESLTVRAIAREAGVNVAAINYYFRSKEALLEEVLGRAREVAFDGQIRELDAIIEDEAGDLRAALERFVPEFLRDALRYPRLAAAHFREVISGQDYESPEAQACGTFFEAFFVRVRPVLPPGPEEEQRLRVVAFWSSIYLNVLMPRLFDKLLAQPIAEPPGAGRYARVLLAGLLGKSEG